MTKKPGTAYQRWLAKNREKLNEQRNQRYHSDPEYRQTILERAKELRQKHKKYDPVPEGAITLHQLAEAIERDVGVLYKLERDGLVPHALKANGQKYYLPHQADLIRKLIKARGDRNREVVHTVLKLIKTQW